jgi:hypothetical protein
MAVDLTKPFKTCADSSPKGGKSLHKQRRVEDQAWLSNGKAVLGRFSALSRRQRFGFR